MPVKNPQIYLGTYQKLDRLLSLLVDCLIRKSPKSVTYRGPFVLTRYTAVMEMASCLIARCRQVLDSS